MKKIINMKMINGDNDNTNANEIFSNMNYQEIFNIMDKATVRTEKKYGKEVFLMLCLGICWYPEFFNIDHEDVEDLRKYAVDIISYWVNYVIKQISTKRAYECMRDNIKQAVEKSLMEIKKEKKSE